VSETTASSVRTIKRSPRVGDVVVAASGQAYEVEGVQYASLNGPVDFYSVVSLTTGLPNTFHPRQVEVVTAKDAAWMREHLPARLARERAETAQRAAEWEAMVATQRSQGYAWECSYRGVAYFRSCRGEDTRRMGYVEGAWQEVPFGWEEKP
jgi:uridine phosphorylase